MAHFRRDFEYILLITVLLGTSIYALISSPVGFIQPSKHTHLLQGPNTCLQTHQKVTLLHSQVPNTANEQLISTENDISTEEEAEESLDQTTLQKIDSLFQNSILETNLKSVAAVAVFVLADGLLKQAFKSLKIGFPAPLAGMVALFSSLVASDLQTPGIAYSVYSFLNEGAKLLATWLPLFFVPSLVVLPLIDPIPLASLGKLALITAGGWILSLVTTAKLVQAIPPLYTEVRQEYEPNSSSTPAPSAKPKPAFSAKQETVFAISSASLGVLSLLFTHLGFGQISGPVKTLFLLMTTASSFIFGSRLPAAFKAKVHPLITCTAITLGVIKLYALLSFQAMQGVLKGYLTKGAKLGLMGSGDFLLAMLGPSIISFACKMFEHRALMAKNVNKVLGGCIGGSAFGIFGTAVLARLLNVQTALRLSTVSRQVTTPLAIAMATMLGANVSIAVAMVVITGILGANYGRKLLDTLKIEEPVARGLSMGVSSHGLGTAAMVSEPNAFALSAIGMALTATFSTIIISIPSVKNALISFTLASAKKML